MKFQMLTFYGLILLLSFSLQEHSAEFPVLLMSPEAFTPFDHVWNTVFPESEKTNPIEYTVPPNCETAQAKKWQDIAKHMDMSKVALTFPLCIVILST